MIYADIIVDISHESIDKTFQYSIPTDLQASVSVGTKVDIPFGNRREMTGYVVGLSEVPKISAEKIKEIKGISPKAVSLDGRMLALAAFIKTNYGGTMNEALKTVLPVKKSVRPVIRRNIELIADEGTTLKALEEARNRHFVARVRLLSELLQTPSLPKELIENKLNISQSTITSLQKMGLIEVTEEQKDRNKDLSSFKSSSKTVLNDEQQNAADTIINSIRSEKPGSFLIYGVTGSGKTEVYMEIIEEVVRSGKQVIVLIPEISLTFQTVMRFSKRFGNKVAFFNSRLSDGERYDQYVKAKTGQIDIMIGPRSALFTPFENPGLIVIDEEHEGAYKSEGVPKYHAREVAQEICRMTGASLVLGSATPSLESYKRALSGEYTLLKLTKRAKATAVLPEVHVVDLREELKNKNKTMFSLELVNDMADRLRKHEQIMLFLNRRGYSGFVSCRACGEAIKCPHCSVTLTQHRDGKLRCHYCGYEELTPRKCPSCGSAYIAAFGTGTEKVEESVKKLFPAARTLRMDADTTKDKESYEQILSSFANEEADVLIGTQMIVKGHDFPSVTLVGILAADLSLYASDYRSSEKTFQLLAQAAGRAGRASLPGKVIIQTYKPDHYAVECASKQDYELFYEQESAYRKVLKFPPEGHMLAVIISGRSEDRSKEFIERLSRTIVDKFRVFVDNNELDVVGPAPCDLSKVNDFYRFIIYFKTYEYNILTDIGRMLDRYGEYVKEKQLIMQTDFDPMGNY